MGYLAVILAGLYLLYLGGYLPVSSKSAVTFVGSGRHGASFTSCTGQIHRIIRFQESRSYSFQLSGRIQQGKISAWVLDRNKQQVLRLDGANSSGILTVEQGKRYYLYVRFENASGDYQLDWA